MARKKKGQEPEPGISVADAEAALEGKPSNVVDLAERRAEREKPQEVPKGSTWTLRGLTSDVVLQEGISETNASHLLRGKTSKPLVDVKLGADIEIVIDDLRFKLQRTA